MIRRIGGGAYGQVWMARSVTGAHRAVKLVSREDFRLEKTFEREFEGIKYFESVSRVHPGLVDILHVGRSYEDHFYFYVMELADDQKTGEPAAVDPLDYRPRTLRSDISSSRNVSLSDCAQVGAVLADALHYLHERGLTHRDVKPSNVIFVDGQAKLADIGLVAETGQQTFVGTEGFVAPEGPGSVHADIYSLGMVLYEMSTGKDRLDFPELPDHLHHEGPERERWKRLNEIVCRCCQGEPRKRFPSAKDLAKELQRLAAEAPATPFPWAKAIAVSGAAIVSMWSLGAWPSGGLLTRVSPQPGRDAGEARRDPGVLVHDDASPPASIPTDPPLPNREKDHPMTPLPGHWHVVTEPHVPAWVYTLGGQEVGQLPLTLQTLREKGLDQVIIEPLGFKPVSFDLHGEYEDRDGDQEIELVPDRKPTPGRAWTNSLGMVFRLDEENGRHLSRWPVTADHFKRFLDSSWPRDDATFETVTAETLYPGYDGTDSQLVLTDLATAEAFCRWLTDYEAKRTTVFLHIGQIYEPEAVPVFAGPHVGGQKILFRCHLKVVHRTQTESNGLR